MSDLVLRSANSAAQQTNGTDERWDSFGNLSDLVANYYRRLSEGLQTLAANDALQTAVQLIWSTLSAGTNIFVAGNGGSATNGMHLATDISLILSGCDGHYGCCGGIHSLTDSGPILSAIANDFGSDDCFSRQLAVLAAPGDLLIVLSVSGRSENIIKACETARQRHMKIIGLFGEGSTLDSLTTVSVTAADLNYGRVEDMHLSICHVIASFIRQQYQRKHANSPVKNPL